MSAERPTERRLVTCVFIDVVGSTDLVTRVGPERMRRLLDEAFAEISARATVEGGTVEKYIGDEVFILFGAPITHSDDAARALRLAMACVDWVRASDTPLSVRVGVETGEALVDLEALDARQRMAVGTCVNVAARLQAHADTESALVGPTCRAATEGVADFDEPREVELKGVGRVKASRLRGLRTTGAREAPFVGRDADLTVLRRAWSRTTRGRATFVVVSGEPGIGKTRLVEEFVHDASQQATVVRARCRPGTEVGAATPLRQLVTDRAELPAAIAHAVGISRDERLLALASIDRRNEIELAWREYFGHLATKRPIVMYVDDLQWAEPETVAVLDRITFRNDVPLLVVATARPDFPGLAAIRPGDDRLFIELAPLGADDASALARSVGGGIERALRAAGNPLFILELARAKVGPGAEVPLTLQAAIAARLDELAQPERDLLQRVAIVGDTFTIRDAALLSERLPAEVAGMLGRLVHLKYIEQVRAGHRFHHVLLRDVAYGRLAAENRLALHATYARSGIDPDNVEALAHHYWEAIGTPEAEWVWKADEREAMHVDALAAHVAAGERLGERLAAEGMVTVFEHALRLAKGPIETANVEEAFALAYGRNAKGEDATVHRLRAIELRRSAGEPVPAKLYADTMDLPVNNWGYFKRLPSTEQMLRLIDDGIAAARASGQPLELMRLLVHRARVAEDLTMVPEIDELARSAADMPEYADAFWRLAMLYLMELLDIDRARAALDRCFTLAAQGAQFNEPEAVMWRSIVLYHAGDLAGAERDARRLEELSVTKSAHTQQHSIGAGALTAFARGDWAEVRAHGEDLRTLVAANPDASWCIWGVNLLGWNAVASVIDGRPLPDELESLTDRLLPDASLTHAATLLPALAMAGRPTRDADAARSYTASARIADRQSILDVAATNLVLASVVRERWQEAEACLARLDDLARRGARYAAALAEAVREEIAHTRGGAEPRHAMLRDLGYVGISQLLRYRAKVPA